MHVNINGLLNKFEKLKFYNNHYNFDIICLTETHITKNNNEWEYHLEHYECIKSYTNSKHTAGLVIFIKNPHEYKLLKSYYCDKYNINLVVLQIYIDNQYFTLIVVYRSPSSPIIEFFKLIEACLTELYMNNLLNIIIIGDINIDYLSMTANNRNWKQLIESFNLQQINTQYTHRTFKGERLTKTIIDHVVVEETQKLFSCKNEYKLIISDHVPQIVYIDPKIYNKVPENIKIKKLNFEIIKNEILKFDIRTIIFEPVNEKFDKLINFLEKTEKDHTQEIKKTVIKNTTLQIPKYLSKKITKLNQLVTTCDLINHKELITYLNNDINENIDQMIKQKLININYNDKTKKKTWNFLKSMFTLRPKQNIISITHNNTKLEINKRTLNLINFNK